MEKSRRSMISRREPLIALTSFRYRGRNYEEGDWLDRRRTRMPHSRLVRFIREERVALARDLSDKALAAYGWEYLAKEPRNKLRRLEIKKKKKPTDPDESNAASDTTDDPSAEGRSEETPDTMAEGSSNEGSEETTGNNGDEETLEGEKEVRHLGGGWYAVFVGETRITEKALRRKEAEALLIE